MRIGFDLRQATLGSAGGISLLLKGVLETLFRNHPEHEYTVICTLFNRSLLDRAPAGVEFQTLPINTYMTDLCRIAHARNFDVLFRGYPLEQPLDFPLQRQIFLIPDIQHEYYPEFFPAEVLRTRRAAFSQALRFAGAIGTISEYARQTLHDQPDTRCNDIFLMSPALQEDHRLASETGITAAERALVPKGDFFLYPANLWPHKNHRRIFQAFGRYLERTGCNAEFICTGHSQGWSDIHAEFEHLPIRHLGFVRAPLLRLLFQKTRALTFFSLYEGFGMPLLEAFDVGTPVICSNTTSLPEVGGDAVLSCDPTDIDAMAGLMGRISDGYELRSTLIARGKQRLHSYTWQMAAENLLAACTRVGVGIAPESVETSIEALPSPPLVSIVTPSYNQGRFLRRTIDSVLNQTYPHIEYCVMDGGSNDESVEILKSYGDRFRWVSERDGGQTPAINKGFAQSRGEIRAYLNSDDTLYPDAVAKAVSHFHHRPSCDMVYGCANYIDENDQVTGTYNSACYSFERLMQDCCVCQPAAFWRTRIAEKVGPFDESLNYAMDYDYWIRIDRAGGVLEHIPDFLANSRLYAETKTLSCRYDIYQEIFRVCERHTGSVDINYFKGLWQHLCYERRTGLPGMLRRIPRFDARMAYLHHKWFHRRQYSTQHVARKLKRVMLSASRRLIAAAQVPLRSVNKAHAGEAFVIDPCFNGRYVSGLWSDNWLAPECKVVLRHHRGEQPLHLAGTALHDMTLTIHSHAGVIGSHQIPAHHYVKIDVPHAADMGDQLRLEFSRHSIDGAQRPISFLMQDTNLFTEQDLG